MPWTREYQPVWNVHKSIFSDVLEGSLGRLNRSFRIAISQYLANKLGVVLGDKVSVLPTGSAFSARPQGIAC